MANEVLTAGKLAKVFAALDANWQAKMEGHWTYQTLADRDHVQSTIAQTSHLMATLLFAWHPTDHRVRLEHLCLTSSLLIEIARL